jgi:hypothetical protein
MGRLGFAHHSGCSRHIGALVQERHPLRPTGGVVDRDHRLHGDVGEATAAEQRREPASAPALDVPVAGEVEDRARQPRLSRADERRPKSAKARNQSCRTDGFVNPWSAMDTWQSNGEEKLAREIRDFLRLFELTGPTDA